MASGAFKMVDSWYLGGNSKVILSTWGWIFAVGIFFVWYLLKARALAQKETRRKSIISWFNIR